MELMFKWDRKNKRYDPYEKPWHNGCRTIAKSGEKVLCAGCGKKIIYDNGYHSRTIHDRAGMAYMVCEKCLSEELEEEKRWLNGQN